MRRYILDIEFILHENESVANLERRERYEAQQDKINDLLNLDFKYLNSAILQLQEEIVDYYKQVVADSTQIQSLVMAFFVISAVGF
jgi:hypothetical protein